MTTDGSNEIKINPTLLRTTVKLNTILLAGMCGFVTGVGLLFMTYISLNRGMPYPGHYLNLLGHFMPGYEVSATGAWIGLLWGSIYGAIAGALIYRIYAKTIPLQVEELVNKHQAYQNIDYVTLKINSAQFGIAMGALIAVGTFAATMWLVFQGTATYSKHMALLANFLPGYSVSISGSIIGAIELFIIVYAGCYLFGTIYNKIVNKRHKV